MMLTSDQLNLAAKAFDTALALLAEKKPADPEQAQIDLSLILTVQSYLYEAQDNREKAVAAAQRHVQLHPDQQNSKDRLALLQSEPLNPDAAKDRLNELFSNSHVCSAEEHVHDEHCEHDHEEHVHGPQCDHD